MKVKFNTKYNTIAVYSVIVFSVFIVIVLLAFRLNEFINITKKILSAIAPVMWGIIIAYVLSPMTTKAEKILNKKVFKKKSHANLNRTLSIIISSVIFFSVIVTLISLAVPEIIRNMSGLLNNMPEYLNSLYNSVIDFFNKNPKISSAMSGWFEDQFENIEETILNRVTNLKPVFEKYLILLKDGVLGFLVGLKDFLLGYIVSIYLLYSKERFIRQFKKITYALMPKKAYDTLMIKGKQANKIFSSYITGVAIDSFFVGVVCFIILAIFKIPNAMLISFIIGITNAVPFFGPFIGAIPSALLVLLTAPDKTITFIIIILVLQQFDGNIINPKILGNKLNLPTFWILFPIFFFGNLIGFLGILLGVPIFAVIYTLTSDFIYERIHKKNLRSVIKEDDIDKSSDQSQ